jgi:hypothetical protein
MNERIQELMRQATEYKSNGDDTESPVLNPEKFAKLIVQECVEYYRSQVGETSEPHTRTLEHFGVE